MPTRKITLAAALVAAFYSGYSGTEVWGQPNAKPHHQSTSGPLQTPPPKRPSRVIRLGTTAKEAKFQAVTDYAYQINREGHGQLLRYLRTKGNTLIVVVNEAWSAQPYRYRLQKTQGFGGLWKKALDTTDPATAPFEVRIGNLTGSKVGGWSQISGTWVAKSHVN